MSYVRTTWQNGDTITAAKLNNIEEGILGNETAVSDLNTALSGDISDLNTDISDVADDVTYLKTKLGYINVSLNWESTKYINPSTGKDQTASTCDASYYARVIPNSELEIYSLMRGGAGYAFYDENLTFISGGGGTDTATTTGVVHRITVPSTAKYIRFSNYKYYGFTSDNAYMHAVIPQSVLKSAFTFGDYIFDTVDDIYDILASGTFDAVDTTVTPNRYISSDGIQGTVNGYNLYSFGTEANCTYHIFTAINAYGSGSTVPLAYFNGTSYPETLPTPVGYVTFEGDGSTAYVNYYVTDDYSPLILKTKEGSFYNKGIAQLDLMRSVSVDLDSTTTDRYITAGGVQGNIGGFTLYTFTTFPDTVYYISSDKGTVASMPIAYFDGTAYTADDDGTGSYMIVGNGEKCYVNSVSTATVTIKSCIFKAQEQKWPNVFRMFDEVVCCGDSLTYSLVYTSSSTSRQAFVPYPEVVEKNTGTPTSYLATAGFDSQEWWETYNGQITGANKLYIIYLGTNDSADSLTDTADTDCSGDDYTTYATTATGYYGRIIRKILDTDSKCVLVKIGLGVTTGASRRAAIEGLGDHFGVPVIGSPQYILSDLYYHYGDDTTYYNTVHLNDMGYEAFGEYVVDAINKLPIAKKYALMPRTTT